MATLATDPSASTATSGIDIKPYNETVRVYVQLLPTGKINPETIRGPVTSGKDNATWNKLDSDASYQLALEQTVKEYEVGTIAGLTQLIEDPEEAVNIINSGLTQKSNAKLKAEFTALNAEGTNLAFEPVTGAYDTIDMLNEARKRRNLSPIDKAKNSMRTAFKALFPGLEGAELEAKVDAMLAGMSS
jgi:hypothetical protein